jgi:hypothetical protein
VLSILQISSPLLGEFSWFFSPMMPMKAFSASSISEQIGCWFQTYPFFRDNLIAGTFEIFEVTAWAMPQSCDWFACCA